MEVLFTHGYFLYEDEKEAKIMRPYPPLGILFLSAYLKERGLSNKIFDTTFSSQRKFFDYVLANDQDVIAIYTNLMTKLKVIESVKFIKHNKPDCMVVLGGPDVTYNVEDYLGTGADLVVIGEGEQTMLEICQMVENSEKAFSEIDGIAFKLEDGSVFKTKARAKIKSVDELPFPNREGIDMQPYLDTWQKYHGKSAMTMSTQRGCPYTCKWCSTAVYGQSYRRRSPDLVAQELKFLKDNYNPDSIWFVDDVFTVSHKWLAAFAESLKKYDAKIPFECITRADRMNEEVIDVLVESGCFRVWIGAESGSQSVIDAMDRRVDVNHVRDMIKLTRKKGMQAGTFIMLGYPGEKEKDIQLTLQHLKESNPDQFTITVAYPIKGTSLYNEIESIQTTDLDWEHSTDRNRDFERSYSRKYYDYAVRWIVNEMNGHQNDQILKSMKYKFRSVSSKIMMGLLK